MWLAYLSWYAGVSQDMEEVEKFMFGNFCDKILKFK